MRLTDLQVRAFPPPTKGQKTYWEQGGLGCRVSQGGTRSFVLQIGKDRRLVTIGRYPVISLLQARGEAKRLLAEHTLGKGRPKSITYQEAVELFLADKAQAKRPSTVYGYRLKLNRLGYKGQLAALDHAEAARRLNRITAPSERSHVLVAAKVFFNWCIKRRYIEHNPLHGLSKPKHTPRTRILSDTELAAIWRATAEPTLPNSIVRLAMVTGQRRGELQQLHPSFLEGNLCTFPPHVTKNGRKHTLPLGTLALQLLEHFPYGTFKNWGQYKTDLDQQTGINEPWVLHDLRRSFKTNLSRLGVAPHISERLLNHISAASPLEWTYDQHPFLEEMRAAVEKWEAKLRDIIGA